MPALRLFPSSLIGRVFLLYLISLLLAVGGAMGWFASRSYADSIAGAQDSADTLISLLGPVVTESAVIGDYDTIERALERAAKHTDISAAIFIDLKGGLIERRGHKESVLKAPDWLFKAIEEQLPELNLNVSAGGRDYGVLRLRFSIAHIATTFWQQTIVAIGLSALGLLIGLAMVWWPLNRWLGNLGRIQTFGEQLQVSGGALSPMLADDAPLEFRKTFEVLNQAASSLQQERERASVTLAAIGDGIATTDAQGLVLLANPVLAQMLERPSEQILGQRIQDLLPDVALNPTAGSSWKTRIRLKPTAGGARVLDLSRTAVMDSNGSSVGWVYACRDFSQQQELDDRLQDELRARAKVMQSLREMLQGFSKPELAGHEAGADSAENTILLKLVQDLIVQLRERGEQLATIFALSPDGFVWFDAAGLTRYVSPAFTRLSGIPSQSALGLQEDVLLRALSARQDGEAAAIEKTQLRHGRLRLSIERPTRRVLELTLHEGSAREGGETSQLLHLSDVTHQVEVDQMKSEFLSTAAHELRTPMASIFGFTELLMTRDNIAPDRQKQMLARIYRQSQAMIAILNELLDLARIEARRGQDFEMELLDLNTVIEEVVQDFKAPDERLGPELSLPASSSQVQADRKKLQQVLRNLLSNAYKYSAVGGRVWLRVSQVAEADAAQVKIEVQDQGIGMTAEELSHVTERFYRADKSGTVLGTGLGMSIVKEIVELHGGQLALASELGQGTTVSVFLPCALAGGL
ncbi:ATP-binding protein [Paucibacter sp. Y2R2-4]|uniref:sensor histidine kinase n=1 Tax=Paucibacter sp. Y2R2-4 TaxID=2893553 RepID=UPI0021E42037|nr:ATP-binding protein [Paucibacter sp. Y2R2-4]MCV2349996.1 PAS domain-containing protein [Paucibacter sp. Y2R2-4]